MALVSGSEQTAHTSRADDGEHVEERVGRVGFGVTQRRDECQHISCCENDGESRLL
jgi:hypothetical protein